MPKYKTVVIDPPWPVDFSAGKRINKIVKWKTAHRSLKKMNQPEYTGEAGYSLKTIDDIKRFPINDYAAKEALLFIWVLNGKLSNIPCIQIGFELLELWGFKYHTLLTWITNHGTCIFSPITNKTEHILFGWRGNFRELTNKQNRVMDNTIKTNYQIKHSEKPAKFYQMLRAWTPEPRIDIFARQRHYGFDGWGDEYVGEGPLAEWLE